MAERVQINEVAKPQYTVLTNYAEMHELMDQGIVVERSRGSAWEPISCALRPSLGWWKMIHEDGIVLRRSPNLRYGLVRTFLKKSGTMQVVLTRYGRTREEVQEVEENEPGFVQWLGGLIWFTIDEKVVI